MNMTTGDWIVAGVVFVILGFAIGYIIKAKKSGQKCIGCPDSKTCSGGCAGCSGCHTTENNEK